MTRRAKFTPITGLDEEVAVRIVAEAVGTIAREVQEEAKRRAPPTKEWVSMGDNAVRKQHRRVNSQVRPDNLRFQLTAYLWDLQHPHAIGAPVKRGTGGGWDGPDADMVEGAFSYLLAPRDQTAGAYVAIVNCRCVLLMHPDGISKLIKRTRTRVLGTKVQAVVYAQGEFMIEAEYGDVYPGDLFSPGTWFMTGAAIAVAARRRGRSARR